MLHYCYRYQTENENGTEYLYAWLDKHPDVRPVVKFVTTDGIETISLFNDALNRALHSLLGNEKTMDIVY